MTAVPLTSCRPRLFLLLTFVAAIFGGSAVAGPSVNPQEQALFDLMAGHSNQQRPFLRLDPTLCNVARARAADMAARNYFDHTDPDGHGPNWWVRNAGYALPAGYSESPSGNNIESITAGRASAGAAWDSWLDSSAHAQHVLATNSFYADQTSVGVGYVNAPGSEYTYYWVVITAPPNGPTLAITSPAPNTKVHIAQITVTGTTSGAPAAASVQARIGAGTWIPAAGTATWSVVLGELAPGENLVTVRSLNAAGAVLDEASRTVRYALLGPLIVEVAGSGTVTSGFEGITQRELGRDYVITATPSNGSIFAGWSGSMTSASAELSFTMAAGLSLRANFIPNPFANAAGQYIGLFSSGDLHGQLRVKLGRAGAFSGKVRYRGLSVALHGTFDPNGNATVTTALPGGATLNVNLHLDHSGVWPVITGSVSDGTFTAGLSSDLTRPANGAPSSYAGRYTMVISAVEDGTGTTPNGDGFASLLVGTDGAVTLSAVLAEGTKLLASGFVSPAGTLSLYAPLYGGAGILTGRITFRTTAASDLDGRIYWAKPEIPGAALCPAAFAIETAVVGSAYDAPAPGVPVLAVTDSANNTALGLGDGDLSAQIVQPTTLREDNSVSINAPIIPGVAVAVKANSGRFIGRFVHPVTGTATKLRGVILQKQNIGFGFFPGSATSGYATFAPAGMEPQLQVPAESAAAH